MYDITKSGMYDMSNIVHTDGSCRELLAYARSDEQETKEKTPGSSVTEIVIRSSDEVRLLFI